MVDGGVTVVVPSLGRMQQRWTDQLHMLPDGLPNLSLMLSWQRGSLYRSVLATQFNHCCSKHSFCVCTFCVFVCVYAYIMCVCRSA